MSVAHQLSLVERLGALYHDEVRELCRRMGMSPEDVTDMRLYRDADWNFEGPSFQFEGQTYESSDVFFGKGFTAFVAGSTLHVLYTLRRKK